MKIDLGALSFDLPNDPYVPVTFLAMGKEDKQEALSAGPTMAKTQAHTFKRSFQVVCNYLPNVPAEEILEKALNAAVTRVKGKVLSVQKTTIKNGQARLAEFTYSGPGAIPLRTLAMIVYTGEYIITFLFSSLQTRQNDAEVRKQFNAVVESFSPAK